MKLKYYYNQGEYLYRKNATAKKKQKNALQTILKITAGAAIVLIAVLFVLILTNKFLTGNKKFNIKYASAVVANEKIVIDKAVYSALLGKNIFKLNTDDVQKITDKNLPEYGVRTVSKRFPQSVKIVLYKRTPLFLVNNEFIINNDLSITKADFSNSANCTPVYYYNDRAASVFDIPGFATLLGDFLKYRNLIKKISITPDSYIVSLKSDKRIIVAKGQNLPNISKITETAYSTLDYRFKGFIFAKK